MPGKKGKKPNSGLGRAIVRSQRVAKDRARERNRATGVSASSGNPETMQSMIETNSLHDFLAQAALEQRSFRAQKGEVIVVDDSQPRQHGVGMDADDFEDLSIPRRPTWTKSTTAQELDEAERKAFLEWRRGIAHREEATSMPVTPFEKNINVWRQLWRVVERSDVVVQIVDARNPLLFRCPDLEHYAREVDPGKRTLLVFNKSDFLPEEYRMAWADYFLRQGVDFIFFSAKAEQTELDRLEEDRKRQEEEAAAVAQRERALADVSGPAVTEEAEEEREEGEGDARDPANNAGRGAGGSDGEDESGVGDSHNPAVEDSHGPGSQEDEEDDEEDEEEESSDEEGSDDEGLLNSAFGSSAASAAVAPLEQVKEQEQEEQEGEAAGEGNEGDAGAGEGGADAASGPRGHAELPRVQQEAGSTEEGRLAWTPEYPVAVLRRLSRVLDRTELLSFLERYSERLVEQKESVTIGMTGFPNVGKSSLINVLLGASARTHGRRVTVSATPGKTKHFQTMELTDKLTLCDCPGLVFPTFMRTKAEMVCNGVLPIDQLRDHVAPIAHVVQRIPRSGFERRYGFALPLAPDEDPAAAPDPRAVVQAFSRSRGFMASHHGGPDEPRGARFILKDYVSGALCYCHPPPQLKDVAWQRTKEQRKEEAEAARRDAVARLSAAGIPPTEAWGVPEDSGAAAGAAAGAADAAAGGDELALEDALLLETMLEKEEEEGVSAHGALEGMSPAAAKRALKQERKRKLRGKGKKTARRERQALVAAGKMPGSKKREHGDASEGGGSAAGGTGAFVMGRRPVAGPFSRA